MPFLLDLLVMEQIPNQTCSETIPRKLSVVYKKQKFLMRRSCCTSLVFAEICIFSQNSLPADDFRTINETRYTCLINDETIDVWRQKLLEKNSSNSVK